MAWTDKQVSREEAEEMAIRPTEERPLGAPEVVQTDLAVPVVVLTTRDYYVLAAMQGVLATKANIAPHELRERCDAIVAEFLGE